ncbi:acyltransferase family protein [Henriciella litoralis]|uniref:acyltransferase family protein n=1 Tax=Henriciella litoralis TaxID=568102 RepID=UPI0009FFC924|nr:acyltransferase [Henriciella litoralis]
MKIAELQALRALASYLVLFHHIRGTEVAHGLLDGTPVRPAMQIFYSGYAGVDLFFAISGFVMVYVTYKLPSGPGQTLQFWLARIFRIYPVWWFYCALFSILCLIIAGTLWHPSAFDPAETNGWIFLIKSWFLIPQPDLPHINVGWTLIHEVHFYIVFGFLLLLPKRALLLALLGWSALIVGVHLVLPKLGSVSSLLAIAFSPFSLEFIAGAIAGWLFVTGRRHFHLPILLIGAASFAAALFLLEKAPAPWQRVEIFALPSAALVYGASGVRMPVGRLRSVLSRLGDWSFSLYLCHPLVMICLGAIFTNAAKLAPSLGLPSSLFVICGNGLFVLAAVIASTIVAALSYHFYERKTLDYLNRRFRHRQTNRSKAALLEEVGP